MEQKDYKSRAERIQEARKCCHRQQYDKGQTNSNKKNQDTVSVHYRYQEQIENLENKKQSAVKKTTLIRLFFAAFLFLFLFTMEHFQWNLGVVSIDLVKQMLCKNTLVEQLETKTADFIEENILAKQ